MRLLELTKDQLVELRSYLTQALLNHRAERSELDARWVAEAQDFWAESSTTVEELPNTGFATLMVPLTAIAAEAIHARIMGMTYAMKELVLSELCEKYDHLRPGMDHFWNYQFQKVLRYRDKSESSLLEAVKHGTGVMAIGHREIKRNKVLTQDDKEISVPIYIEKGTCIDSISISDFLMPFTALDTIAAPWVGNDFRYSERDVKQAVATGYFYPEAYSQLMSHYNAPTDTESVVLANVREQTNTEPTFPSEVRLSRIFCEFNTEDDEFKEIEVIIHDPSGIICHISYPDERPYEKGVYMPLENRWYGYGIAKQNRDFQIEVTTQHRQRIDNATIANMSMFKVKESARQYIKDDEPIFPGKKFYVQDMDDIEPLNIGDVKASAYNNENQVVIYSQQRTGVNELTLGMPNTGTPGTASDSLARVQESNRKADYTHSNLRTFQNNVIYRAAQSIIRHESYDVSIFEYIQKGSEIQSFLMQKELLSKKYVFDITLTGAKNNKVLDRNTYTQLVGMHTQYVTSSLELLGQLDPTLMQPAIEQVLASSNMLYMQILNAFDVPNPEKLILNLDAIRAKAIPPATPQPAIQGMAPQSPSGPSSIMAPGARISLAGGSPNLQLSDPTLSLAG